ncbi:MAG: hypothetical protein J6T56_08235, partial [Bacteroidales bacterium]|nr:hypothetical protein [Bacteroidales bacterium]
MRHIYKIILFTAALLPFSGGGNLHAQIRDRVESVREADPVVVSGKVGTHLGLSYNSLQPNSTPFSSTLYANLNLS